jgi:hypothetical protein
MESYSATKKKEVLLLANKWMELENIILNEVSQAQKVKNHIHCSPSYADYSLKANAVILLHMGHTLRGECLWKE